MACLSAAALQPTGVEILIEARLPRALRSAGVTISFTRTPRGGSSITYRGQSVTTSAANFEVQKLGYAKGGEQTDRKKTP